MYIDKIGEPGDKASFVYNKLATANFAVIEALLKYIIIDHSNNVILVPITFKVGQLVLWLVESVH